VVKFSVQIVGQICQDHGCHTSWLYVWQKLVSINLMIGKEKEKGKEENTTERRFGVILKDINSKFELVLEGYSALNKKFNVLKEGVSELRKDMDYKFEIVLEELSLIRNELKAKVDRDEFVLLERRVEQLEKITNKSNI